MWIWSAWMRRPLGSDYSQPWVVGGLGLRQLCFLVNLLGQSLTVVGGHGFPGLAQR